MCRSAGCRSAGVPKCRCRVPMPNAEVLTACSAVLAWAPRHSRNSLPGSVVRRCATRWWQFVQRDLSRRISDFRNQLRKAACAAPRLVAEGFGRFGNKEFRRYLSMARAELMEVQSDLIDLERTASRHQRVRGGTESPGRQRPQDHDATALITQGLKGASGHRHFGTRHIGTSAPDRHSGTSARPALQHFTLRLPPASVHNHRDRPAMSPNSGARPGPDGAGADVPPAPRSCRSVLPPPGVKSPDIEPVRVIPW